MTTSRRAYFPLVLSLVGLAICAYLGWMHLGLLRGEMLGGAGCTGAAGSVFNCHAVTAGKYGFFAGFPLWVWGSLGYLAIFYLSLVAVNFTDAAKQAVSLIFAVSLFSVGVDVVLLGIMATRIHYFCLFCLLTQLTNLLLLIASAWAMQLSALGILKEAVTAMGAFLPGTSKAYGNVFWPALVFSAAGVFTAESAAVYVAQGSPKVMRQQIQDFVSRESREHISVGDSPYEGSESAPVTVVEFSDFFCPACQRASKFKPILLSGRKDEVRFVFKHFPLDTDCNDAIGRMVHPGACQIAAAAKCAQKQEKFWLFHDHIFTYGHDYQMSNLQKDVKKLGLNADQFNQCLSSGEGMAAVRMDVAEGKRLGISSTPTFFVNGLKMPGIMTPAVFETLVETLKSDRRGSVMDAQSQ